MVKEMRSFTSQSVIVVFVFAAILLNSTWASAGSLPTWGGATTTNKLRVQQPRQPIASQPAVNTAQTVQLTQPGIRTRTTPRTTSSSTVLTPMQQRVSQPTIEQVDRQADGQVDRQAETPMSIAQDECVLYLEYTNPAYSELGMQTAGFGTVILPSEDELAAAMANGGPYISNYIVLEKGDYKAMYLPELILLQNLNKNNSVEFLVRLPGINMTGAGLDDWTKGKKRSSTLRPGESAQFDEGSGTTLIKVRCP